MLTITKSEKNIIDGEDIKTKLYLLKLGEQLVITTKWTTRIFERVQ